MTGLSETIVDILTILNIDVAQRKSIVSTVSPIRQLNHSLRRRSHHHRHKSRTNSHTRTGASAIFLRDIEEGIFNHSAGFIDGRIDITSRKQFLETRIHNPPYPWLLVSHRKLSTEIANSRKRLGILRYDLLLTFQMVNTIDKKLLEIEYVNWLLDERAKCNKAKWMLIKDEMFFDDLQSPKGEAESRSNNNGDSEDVNVDDATTTRTNKDDSYYRLRRFKYENEFKSVMRYCYDVRKQIEGFSR
ncbi:14372_t:CDS:2 [Entrophospora sp. SA101]|nr:5432_t:CDS:2 [Entrophospora sp. SA101]CAJ0631780.1 14372_t:CDS:2 [Entrophospora sp. SA101]CAJ0825296.1 5899_t:CDS:2 [Entrophospora sp. SA101]CAJ0826275.1 9511_t:CDS:2 [Entrophospora sp. SA101]CAJ0921685.1 6910_t:CDS:2 [Entrophospora sp. SA101]